MSAIPQSLKAELSHALLSELPTLTDVARTAAQEAAQFICSQRGQHGEVMAKVGSSAAATVVTEVDRQAQSLILSHLAPSQRNFDLGLLAEEAADDGSRLSKQAFWCIDPLDGTLPFIEGRDGFAVSIALVARDGTPLIGVAINPLNETIYDAWLGAPARRQIGYDNQPQLFQPPSDNQAPATATTATHHTHVLYR